MYHGVCAKSSIRLPSGSRKYTDQVSTVVRRVETTNPQSDKLSMKYDAVQEMTLP